MEIIHTNWKITNTVSFVSTQQNHHDTLQQFNKVFITMGVHSHKNKLLIITEPKTIYFELPQNIVTNLMKEIDYMIK